MTRSYVERWPAVLYILSKFHKSKKQANLNYNISIKKNQALLKCFINLKCSVCLVLGSETKPCFVTLRTFFRSTVGQSAIFNKFDLSKNPKRSERIDADELSKASSTGNEILACDAALSKKKIFVKERDLGMRNSVFGVPQ